MSIAEKLTTIAENLPKVYDAGVKSEYDKFWDGYQKNGKSAIYGTHIFAYECWNDDTFFPKYDIIPYSGSNGSSYFFRNKVTNLRERIDGRGLKLDLKNNPSLNQYFRFCSTCELPDMDTSGCTNFTELVADATNLHTIPRLNMTNATTATTPFYNTPALQNITFEGTISLSISFKWSPLLTIESLRSIISALYDFVGNGETTTRTLTLHADAKARLTADDIKAITDKGWTLV